MPANLHFDNVFTRSLPVDPIEGAERRQISNALYSRVQPTPVSEPALLAWSDELAGDLGLARPNPGSDLLLALAGNTTLAGMDPHATCYGGHQFGNWAGQLGDGRAINLGELVTPHGRRMLQLKGAGPTPYSRSADGRAVLRSSLREFVCSEAMHHLGVPTTRALSLVGTGDQIVRDMLYDGNAAPEPGAIVCRVSESFVRFGHFQMLAARQEEALLRDFTDFVIREHFAEIGEIDDSAERVAAFFRAVSERTADMIVHWMRVGFVHGVMNTDNLSILGETIDYGPYGWLDNFDPDWTPNTTDAGQRRYRFGQQPGIAQWNLMQLGNALLPLVGDAKPLEAVLSGFAERYHAGYLAMMAAKLGLETSSEELIAELLGLLTATETDMTQFFRRLADTEPGQDAFDAVVDAQYDHSALDEPTEERWRAWLQRYREAAVGAPSGDERRERMNRVNPLYVPRNYLAQLAIDDAEQGDTDKLTELFDVLKRPYQEQAGKDHLAEKRPDWARTRVGCSQLSCSS